MVPSAATIVVVNPSALWVLLLPSEPSVVIEPSSLMVLVSTDPSRPTIVDSPPSPTDIVQGFMSHGQHHARGHGGGHHNPLHAHGASGQHDSRGLVAGANVVWAQWGLVYDSTNVYMSLQQLGVALQQAQGKATYEHNHHTRRRDRGARGAAFRVRCLRLELRVARSSGR